MKQEEIEQRIGILQQQVHEEPNNEALWLELGHLHWQLQDWQQCLADYDAAIGINPKSRAITLRQMALQVIGFYYKDRYNP